MSFAIRPDLIPAGLVFNTGRVAPFNVVRLSSIHHFFRVVVDRVSPRARRRPFLATGNLAGIRNCTPACRAVSAADREPGTTLPGGPIRSFLQSVIVLLVSRYAGLVVRVRPLVGAGFFFEHSREG